MDIDIRFMHQLRRRKKWKFKSIINELINLLLIGCINNIKTDQRTKIVHWDFYSAFYHCFTVHAPTLIKILSTNTFTFEIVERQPHFGEVIKLEHMNTVKKRYLYIKKKMVKAQQKCRREQLKCGRYFPLIFYFVALLQQPLCILYRV